MSHLDKYMVRDINNDFKILYWGTYDECVAWVKINPPEPGRGYEIRPEQW